MASEVHSVGWVEKVEAMPGAVGQEHVVIVAPVSQEELWRIARAGKARVTLRIELPEGE